MELKNKQRITVRHFTQDKDDSWDFFLQSQNGSNFYQSYDWKGINERNFDHTCFYLGAVIDDTLVGVLPLVYVESQLFGRILSSMPFVNFGGICASTDEVVDQLLQEANKLAIEQDADYLEIRSLESVSDTLPTSLNKISMTIDLDSDPEVLWNAFKSKHRTNIRRVYKNNIHVKQGSHDLLDCFYTLLSKSWKHLGTPIYKKSYFKDILNTFPDQIKIFVAYQGNVPIATAFNGYFKDTVEGMWAGALPEQRSAQANYVLYWEMIKDACENGFKHYHLGRSTADSGAESFKKKWNAQAKQLYWQYILNKKNEMPQLNVSNPKFELAIKIWRKLPLPFTQVLGPLISPYIP